MKWYESDSVFIAIVAIGIEVLLLLIMGDSRVSLM